MSSEITSIQRVLLALDFLSDIVTPNDASSPASNIYIGIGHNTEWSANDQYVESVVESTDYLNQIRRNLVAMKKLSISNSNLVVRRQDWVIGSVYTAYDETLNMLSTTLIANANGTISVNTATNVISGTNTTFTNDYEVGALLQLSGDGVNTFPIIKEVVSIYSNDVLLVNTPITAIYTANTPQIVEDTYPNYAYQFYVRNTYDQVFVCLNNNNGAQSLIMPQISLGGQLPSDAFIIMSDGYYWKYLYTIPSGLKEQYFTDEWMPITTDVNVLDSVVSGRLDIVNIINSGHGYFNSVPTMSAPILTVVGDGTGAHLSAHIDDSGSIIGVNILNAGSGYTKASVIITDIANSYGANGQIEVVIGPHGGWGSNVAFELGATNIMISLDLEDTEDGTIPIVDVLGNYFSYRSDHYATRSTTHLQSRCQCAQL